MLGSNLFQAKYKIGHKIEEELSPNWKQLPLKVVNRYVLHFFKQ